jgi:hypothetical protein
VRHQGTADYVDLAAIAQWAERLKALGSLSERHHEALLQALDDARRGRLEQPPEPLLTVLLFGASGVGKSQLLNALAGEAIAPVHFLRPTTRVPTVYAHEAVQAERLFAYGTTLGTLTQFPAYFQRHCREPLRHVVMIDAPDIDSYVPEHREQVMQLLPAVDVVLYVVTPESYKNDLGWQAVLQERGRHGFAFVMNKWDSEGKRRVPAGQTDVDDDFLTLLKQRGGYLDPLLFRVSSAYWVARHAHATMDVSPAQGEQFPELQQWLSSELSTSQVDIIQQRRRRALWGSLMAAVSAAQPVAVGDTPWQETLVSTLSQLRTGGWQVIRPTLVPRAHLLAHAYGIGAWPHSPGPFGLCLRALDVMRSFGRGLVGLITIRRGHNPQHPALTTQEVVPLGETERVPGRLRQRMDECIVSLELQARQYHIPLPWLSHRWHQLVEVVPSRLATAVDQTAAALLDRPFGRLRYACGVMVMALLELLLTVFLCVVVWRLGTAFVWADYLGVIFVINAMALLGCIILCGYVLLSWCFPRPEQLCRRKLESALNTAWDQAIDDMENTAMDFLVELKQLSRQGAQIMQTVTEAIDACHPPADSLPAENASQTERLFARAPE